MYGYDGYGSIAKTQGKQDYPHHTTPGTNKTNSAGKTIAEHLDFLEKIQIWLLILFDSPPMEFLFRLPIPSPYPSPMHLFPPVLANRLQDCEQNRIQRTRRGISLSYKASVHPSTRTHALLLHNFRSISPTLIINNLPLLHIVLR